MSILIRGMEMPCEEAEPLRLELYADGTVIVIKEQDDFYEFKAVPVPAHGRCIDADALWVKINKICDRRDAGIISDLTCLQQLLSAVRHAPTILPAEESEI